MEVSGKRSLERCLAYPTSSKRYALFNGIASPEHGWFGVAKRRGYNQPKLAKALGYFVKLVEK